MKATLALADGTIFRGRGIRRRRQSRRRGRLQHLDDRLPGDSHRSVLRRADRRDDVSGDRQHRRQPRRRRELQPVRARLRRQGVLARAEQLAGDAEPRRLHARHTASSASKSSTRVRSCATSVITARSRRCSRPEKSTKRDAASREAPAPSLVGQDLATRRRARSRRTAGRSGTWDSQRLSRREPGDGPRRSPPSTSASSSTSCAISSTRVVASWWCRRTRSADDVRALGPDGLFLSNGPGDPDAVRGAIDSGRGACERACRRSASVSATRSSRSRSGAKTYKMKFGHHGGNQPVHGRRHRRASRSPRRTTVSPSMPTPLPHDMRVTRINLNDRTVEGLRRTRRCRCSPCSTTPRRRPGRTTRIRCSSGF